MILGAHESIAGGYANAVKEAVEDGCESVQIFTKNQQLWKDPEVDDESAAAFLKARKAAGIRWALSHDSYLVNLASSNVETRKKSVTALVRELERCEKLGLDYLVMHPGSHMGQGEERGLELVARGLDEVLSGFKKARTMVLLEVTAGQGSTLGYRFEHFAKIFDMLKYEGLLGICFDTAHAYAAGYDIKSLTGYKMTFSELDKCLGLGKLRAFHLNDSQKPLASRVDRHEQIGKGLLGTEPFKMLLRDKRFATLPAVLETPPLPSGERGYKPQISLLKKLRGA